MTIERMATAWPNKVGWELFKYSRSLWLYAGRLGCWHVKWGGL